MTQKASEPEELVRDASGVLVAKYGDDRGNVKANIAQEIDTIEVERTPSGRLVKKLRRARRIDGVLDRMLRAGNIDQKMYDCGTKFAVHFHRAHAVSGVTLFERSGKSSDTLPSDEEVQAKLIIDEAMDMIGRRTMAGSALWFIVGWGEGVGEWCARQQPKPMNKQFASGLLAGALSTLASHDFA